MIQKKPGRKVKRKKNKNKRANWWWLHPSNRIDGFWAGETAGATSHFHRVGPSLQMDSKIKNKIGQLLGGNKNLLLFFLVDIFWRCHFF
jgi:hypothetical protein